MTHRASGSGSKRFYDRALLAKTKPGHFVNSIELAEAPMIANADGHIAPI